MFDRNKTISFCLATVNGSKRQEFDAISVQQTEAKVLRLHADQ